jgi:hypothetical protein
MIPCLLIRVRCLALLLPACLCWGNALAGLVPSREDIVLLVDNSRSMQEIDATTALPAAIVAFLSRITRDARAALILFDDTVTLEVPFVSVNGEQFRSMMTGLESIDYEQRFSNAAAALERALYELQHGGRKGAGKSIILITPGAIDTGNEANDLNFTRWLTSVLADDAVEARIRIFCIAFSPAETVPLLEDLAGKTGGNYYRFSGDGALSSVFERVGVDMFSKPLPAER